MNTEEQRLSQWMHRVTPEPPRRVTAEDVAARLARPAAAAHGGMSTGSRWVPVLAAAGVALVVATAAAVTTTLRAHHRSSPAVTPTGQVTSSPSPLPGRTSSPTGRMVGPWGAKWLGQAQLAQGSLIGSGDALYALTSGQRASIVRIDPATGAVAARTGYGGPWLPVIAAHTLWTPSRIGGDDAVQLRGFDLTTLAPRASISVPFSGLGPNRPRGPAIAAGPDDRLFLGAGDSVVVIDPLTHRVVRRLHVPGGKVTALAVAPDRTRLYVGVTAGGGSQLQVRDPATGALLAASVSAGNLNNQSLVATAGGVFEASYSGMSETVSFAAASDLSRLVEIGTGGGGLEATTSIAAGAVWIGGPKRISCADPSTGHIRASAALPERHGAVVADISGVAYAHGQAFAVYTRATTRGLVRIHPPAKCTQ